MKNYFRPKLLITKEVCLNVAKSVEKIAGNIWKFHFFAVTLHPLSRQKQWKQRRRSTVLKGKNEASEKFFEKSFEKIWKLQKLALPLHHFRADKTAEVQKLKERAARLNQIENVL